MRVRFPLALPNFSVAKWKKADLEIRLIGSNRAALIALFLTGWATVLTFRGLLARPHPTSNWVILMAFGDASRFAVAASVVFYCYLIWLCLTFYRLAQDKERVLVAGWITGFVLSPMQRLAPSFAFPIQCAKALVMMSALISAILILLRIRKQSNVRT